MWFAFWAAGGDIGLHKHMAKAQAQHEVRLVRPEPASVALSITFDPKQKQK